MIMVESQDRLMGSKELTQIIKGKRTKRQRPSSPLTLGITTSSSSSTGETVGAETSVYNNTSSSPSTSVELTEGLGEEEDMSNCLILLAQGPQRSKLSKPAAAAMATATTTTTGTTYTKKLDAARFYHYVYQCKTCGSRFPSFQALGGHRASHRKPKPAPGGGTTNEEKKVLLTTVILSSEEGEIHPDDNNTISTTLSLQISVNDKVVCSSKNMQVKPNKIHECSTCGAKFSSGQALGGHMRWHRAFATTTIMIMCATSSSPDDEFLEFKKSPNNLQFDLNLPAAPEGDLRESNFSFEPNEPVLVFTASPMVDCHY